MDNMTWHVCDCYTSQQNYKPAICTAAAAAAAAAEVRNIQVANFVNGRHTDYVVA